MRAKISSDPIHKRLLLKLSGEALGGDAGFGIDPSVLHFLANEITALNNCDIEVAVVLGGGNIFRGEALSKDGMDRVTGDRMGMLATVINGLALTDALNRSGLRAQVFSAAGVDGAVTRYNRDDADALMKAGGIAVLAGGTGNPFFTTDTAACLRGAELNVDAVLKATNVDGVYDSDPKTNPNAVRFDRVSYDEVLARELRVMDLTAIVLAKEHSLPVVVFDMSQAGAMLDIAMGQPVGTSVGTS